MMITRIWREQPGDWFFISTKSKSGTWHDQAFSADMLHTVRDYIDENRDKNIYACPHGFTRPYRQKKYAELPNLLWADLDEVDPEDIKLQPTIALESSPGRYVGLWRTDRIVSEDLNKRLTYSIGADKSGWPLTKVLRLLPGSRNYKYAAEPKVKLLWDDGPEYRVRDLERRLPQAEHLVIVERALNRMVPDVTPEEGRLHARKYGCLGQKYLGPCGDKSRVAFKIVKKVAKAGGTPEEAFAIVMVSRASAHYEGDRRRAWFDVLRIASKQAA